jgi:hypothetical protein
MERVLTEKQAYTAMFKFLKDIYEREQPEYILLMLSDMQLLPDGGSADPAYDSDWQSAVDFALAGGVMDRLTFKKES